MTVNVTKPQINLRDKISELDKPSGIAGEAILRSETPQEVFNYIGAGRRNLIINGAMQVAQRGTSATGQTASGYFTCDRWRWSVSSLGTWTTRQSTDAPDGFANSLNAECTTADASPAANDSLFLYHAFEGADLQQLGYGTANAQSITISFWIKATKTGAFQVNWKNNSATRLISSVQTVNSANTWEYKTITFVGYTGGAITNNNNKQAQLEMWFDAGSNFRINPTDTSWAAINNGYSQAYGTNINLGDTVGNQVYITGVQLEVGSVATPFEHRSYGEELALCQRYYQTYRFFSYSGFPSVGRVNSNPFAQFSLILPTPMRASASGTWLGTNNGMVIVRVSDAATETPESIALFGNGYAPYNTVTLQPETTDFATGTAVIAVGSGGSNNPQFELDAEL